MLQPAASVIIRIIRLDNVQHEVGHFQLSFNKLVAWYRYCFLTGSLLTTKTRGGMSLTSPLSF